MSYQDEEKARNKKKIIGGLVLGLIVLLWFIFQFFYLKSQVSGG